MFLWDLVHVMHKHTIHFISVTCLAVCEIRMCCLGLPLEAPVLTLPSPAHALSPAACRSETGKSVSLKGVKTRCRSGPYGLSQLLSSAVTAQKHPQMIWKHMDTVVRQ